MAQPVLWTEVGLHSHLPCKAVFLSLWMWGFWSNGYAAERPTRAACHSLGSEGCDSFPLSPLNWKQRSFLLLFLDSRELEVVMKVS